jgi:hypothetical protein
MNALAEKIRSLSDCGVAALLDTAEGQWLVAECPRHMPEDVFWRIADVIGKGLAPSTAEAVLRRQLARRAEEGGHV